MYEVAGDAELTVKETELISDLCYYHNAATSIQEKALEPDRAELLSCFRLANACDLGQVRAPASFLRLNKDEVFAEGKTESPAEREKSPAQQGRLADRQTDANGNGAAAAEQEATRGFWLRNLLVNGVDLDTSARKVIVRTSVPFEGAQFIPNLIYANLRRIAEGIGPFTGKWSVETPTDITHDGSPVLGIEEMIRFGALLCSAPSAVMASSGDISDYFVDAVIALSQSCAPNTGVCPGTGIDGGCSPESALQTLLDVADLLIDRRPELHALQFLKRQYEPLTKRTNASSALLEASARMSEFREQHRYLPNANASQRSRFSVLAGNAYRRLRRVVGDRDSYRFFLFGYSGPVSVFIQHCSLAGKRVKILPPAMRTVGEGPALKVVDKLRVPELNRVTVEVVPDAAILCALKGLHRDRSDKCDLVLMGCEALVSGCNRPPFGVTDVANSLGAVAVAELAKSADVPVWILTETTKAYCDRLASAWTRGGARTSGQVPVSAFHHEAAASVAARENTARYPRSELIPASLINAIVTDDDSKIQLIGGRDDGAVNEETEALPHRLRHRRLPHGHRPTRGRGRPPGAG
ncbi:MAG: hypothetical protein KBI47_04940 [Armatimonadetes bacterium]|nr:hypothetical protein [Armatimonadota bacterium]